MLMSALKALIAVIPMQLATTFKGVTPALATLDTQGMAFLARVSPSIYNLSLSTVTLFFLSVHTFRC